MRANGRLRPTLESSSEVARARHSCEACVGAREFILNGRVPRATDVIENRPGFRHYGPINFCGPEWQNHGTSGLPESRFEDTPLRTPA